MSPVMTAQEAVGIVTDEGADAFERLDAAVEILTLWPEHDDDALAFLTVAVAALAALKELGIEVSQKPRR
jgi:hypothetical protein